MLVNTQPSYKAGVSKNISFQRAFTSEEMRVYQAKLQETRDTYVIQNSESGKLNNTTLILPDFYAPGKTIASDIALKFVALMKKMTGINVVQGLPRGPVSKDNLSPFSSSPFEIGDHLIDLGKLKASDLKAAYANFKALPESDPLKEDFSNFKQQRPDLERYGILEVLKKRYETDYWPHWNGPNSELDKNLFNYDDAKEVPADKKVRQDELKKDEDVEFYQYRQFIANRQHLDAKNKLNEDGIKLFGDCLIGFSHRDQWAFMPAFEVGKSVGCYDYDGKFNDWGLPCLDFKKLYEGDGQLAAAGKVLKRKFDIFLSSYDGARIDAGWQLSNPATNKGPEYLGDSLLKILQMSLEDQRKIGHDIKTEDINIEELGGPDQAVNLTKNKFPHIHITRYAHEGWGRVAYYMQNMAYKLTGFTIGVGCHDDLSLIQLAEEKTQEQKGLLSRELKTPVSTQEEFRNAKFAELFTSRNQFFTAPDIVGDKRRLNNPGDYKDPQNWRINVLDNGSDPEEIYFRNLSEGKGLNAPKSMAIAIRAKMGESAKTKGILEFLDKAGRILRQSGPNTIQAADKLNKENPNALGERLV